MIKQSYLCDWMGTKFPIIQAPMAGVQGSALAIAVSKAGVVTFCRLRQGLKKPSG
jgi:NAD(P)H-dependent flavin oxidoreductase YrpB (nitropropane dioxygenase family)